MYSQKKREGEVGQMLIVELLVLLVNGVLVNLQTLHGGIKDVIPRSHVGKDLANRWSSDVRFQPSFLGR